VKKSELLREFQNRVAQSQFTRYRPYGHEDTLCPDGKLWKKMGWGEWSNKPWQLEFHNAGKENKERAQILANGVGKSFSVCWEAAAHATGDYPDWFDGYRFDHPVEIWVGSIDADMQRIGTQSHLLGRDLDRNLGTGFIPKEKIHGKVKVRQAGISDVADKVTVKHKSGGYSTINFKTYAQGWRAWQGGKPNVVVLDEEPDENDAKQRDIFEECQTRIFRSGGLLMVAMTPLLGETTLTRHFMMPKTHGIYCASATWDDAPHLNQEDKERLINTYGANKIATRTQGIPMLGEGRIIDVDEASYKIPPFEIPRYFARIIGIDFGIGKGHPTAAASLAWDRDKDTVYLVDEYRKEGSEALYHAESIKKWGTWVPVSWPHDGHKTSDLTREKADGNEVKDIYRKYGLNMLSMSARYNKDKGGAQAQEPIIEELIERIKTDRFKVFSNCYLFFEEARSFHRKDGKVVNRREDLIKAVLYGLMMLRYASPEPRRTHIHSSPAPLRI
jgi:phage terminase large subunit-like protein